MNKVIDTHLLQSLEQEEEYQTSIVSLIALGRQKGFVTLEDVLSSAPKAEEELNILEEIFASLQNAGVLFVEEDPGSSDSVEIESPTKKKTNGSRDVKDDDPFAHIDADDLVGLYLKEAASIPLLTAEEEVELAKKIERGRSAQIELAQNQLDEVERQKLCQYIDDGRIARDHLVNANSRLVISIAKKYQGRGMPLPDLIQSGNIGLLRAIKKFNYRLGYKFSTYATWWIRQAVGRAVAYEGRTIRLPVHLSDTLLRVMRTQHQLRQELDRDPSIEELAKAVNLPLKKVKMTLKSAMRPISLERPINFEDDAVLGDFIEDTEAPAPEETTTLNLLRERVLDILEETLPPREAYILKLRYGLKNGKSLTLREVGEKAGVTRERVRQIEAQAFRRLRSPDIRYKLRAYLD